MMNVCAMAYLTKYLSSTAIVQTIKAVAIAAKRIDTCVSALKLTQLRTRPLSTDNCLTGMLLQCCALTLFTLYTMLLVVLILWPQSA
jgi:hypothetical protein